MFFFTVKVKGFGYRFWGKGFLLLGLWTYLWLLLKYSDFGLCVRLWVRFMFFQEYWYGKRLKLRLRFTVMI